MSTKTERRLPEYVDRDRWPAGPWDGEPDRIAWDDDVTGLQCIMLRNRMGAWCGYVAVPAGHPWHGVDQAAACALPSGIAEPEVHGGVTYSAPSAGVVGVGICHVPKPGEPDDVWWVGFDTAHCFDVVPGLEAYRQSRGIPVSRLLGETYKDRAYVEAQVVRLARQAREAMP